MSMDDCSSDETLTSPPAPLSSSFSFSTLTHMDESLPSTSTSIDDHVDSSLADDCVDQPVFTDIDAEVDVASDVVCNTGIDIDTVVVENDNSSDEEVRRIARFMSEGCKCKLNGGNACTTSFTLSQLSATHDECRQLTHDQLDMVVMGQLRALCHTDTVMQKTNSKNSQRQRTATFFRFGGHRICLKMFLLLHTMRSQEI